MKKLFGKKVAILFLVMNVLLSFLVAHAETNVEFVDCNILQKGISDGDFQEIVQIKTADKDGIVKTYSFAERVRINGSNYRNVQDIYDAIEENSFAKMAVENGVTTVLNFGISSENYENVQYKEKKRCFNTLNSKQSNLPIYYKYNGDFVPAHLDENHYYDIDVYDYAICINEMKSKTEKTVIDYIYIGSKVGGDFTQSINIYCEFQAQDISILKGELYDEGSRLISKAESEVGELFFGGLENETKAYVIKLWLEDREGNEKSCKYIKKYQLNKAEVKDTFVSVKGIRETISGEVVMIKATDNDGIEKTYSFAERVRINGSNYRNAWDIYDAIEENSFAKMVVEDEVITVLNFGSTYETYENAEYNSEAKAFIAGDAEIQTLPVYYRYNEEFVKSYLDENHYYDIEVYDYAICINQMKSKTEKTVIDYIDIGSKIGGDFTQSINIYCEFETQDSTILKGELYDEGSRLISKTESEVGELFFGGLENETKEYVIKFWLEDSEGHEKSCKYTKEYTVNKGEVKNTFISGKRLDSTGFEEVVMIKAADNDGIEKTYYFAERVRINGSNYRNVQDIYNAIEENSFAKMAVEDGAITVLNFGSSLGNYQNAEYNSKDKAFIAGDAEIQSLPVYYRYNEDFVKPYLDENHYYDIDVYDYAICINEMKSKTEKTVIDYIDIGSKIGSDFNQVITVCCEVNGDQSFTLKGRIYDEKRKLVSSAECEFSGYGELTFEKIRNKSENCTIELWLEDDTNKKVSESYIIYKQLMQSKIKYGKVDMKYTNEDEKLILSVRDIDGTENFYVCDENTSVVNMVTLFSSRSTTVDIPEDSFVKMAVDDGVVSVIEIEPENLEIHAQDISYGDRLSGDMYMLNNTQDVETFMSCVAIYSSTDTLKYCDIITMELSSGDCLSVMPELSGYNYEQGDYLRMFAWEDGNIMPLTEAVSADIICR